MSKPMDGAIVFDIETLSSNKEELLKIMPIFEGRAGTKDPEKIAAQIKEKQDKFIADAALDATTGTVALIGYKWGKDEIPTVLRVDECVDGEAGMIKMFWDMIRGNCTDESGPGYSALVGHGICRFDLPFLIHRSMILGVAIPLMRLRPGNHRFWSDNIFDTQEVWTLWNKTEYVKLDTLAKAFGVPGKTGDGSQFAAMWELDKKTAVEYCANDVTVTENVARKMMGVML